MSCSRASRTRRQVSSSGLPRSGSRGSAPGSDGRIGQRGRIDAVTAERSILRDPGFARLWFIQASVQIGGNMALYALTILVFATTRSNALVSALVLSFLIPSTLLSAMGGVLVDRLDVRWAMIVPNTIRTLL